MTEKEYLTDRLEDQITWYDKKSCWNQKWYKRLKASEIVISALIPFASGFILEPLWGKYLIGTLGLTVTILASLMSILKFQENWISYRTTCETLLHEKYFYETKTGPYSEEQNPLSTLVERVENLISKENTCWQQNNKGLKKAIVPPKN